MRSEKVLKRARLAAMIMGAAVSLMLAIPAQATEAGPVELAMAEYVATNAGNDAPTKIAAKTDAYKRHAAERAKRADQKGRCADCKECADCRDCVSRDETRA